MHPRVFGYGSSTGYRKRWQTICKKAGISYLSAHSAGRHGFFTESVVPQIPLQQLKRDAGPTPTYLCASTHTPRLTRPKYELVFARIMLNRTMRCGLEAYDDGARYRAFESQDGGSSAKNFRNKPMHSRIFRKLGLIFETEGVMM